VGQSIEKQNELIHEVGLRSCSGNRKPWNLL